MTSQNTRIKSVQCIDGGHAISVCWSNGTLSRFHALWLRDNAQDPQTRSPENGQRLITLNELQASITIGSASCDGDRVTLQFDADNRNFYYDVEWLQQNAYDTPTTTVELNNPPGLSALQQCWDSSKDIKNVTHDFQGIGENDGARLLWLQDMQRFGITRLVGGPCSDESLFDVVAQFGFVRETNYGRLFNVRTEVNPKNLAYTSLGLQPHTDNPYRDPVPTLQILYCLENTASGGENQVVDGFEAATRLYSENRSGFELLSRYNARFEYQESDDVYLCSQKPMIELNVDRTLRCIRFNNRSIATLTDIPFRDMDEYYAAYRQLGSIIEDPAMAMEFKLQPGECFIVDNTRVLHGRKGYDAGTGYRRLQGCYADNDSLYSTLALLQNKLEGDLAPSKATKAQTR